MFPVVGRAYPTGYSGPTIRFNINHYILPIFKVHGEVSFLASEKIEITPILSIPFEENAYVAHLPDSTDCLIVDPGFEPEKIIDYLERRGLIPAAILITHAHSDHIAGNEVIKNRWPKCQLAIGAADAPKLIDPGLNLSAMFGLNLVSPQADITLEDGEFYTAAGIGLQIRAIPGHSSGHVVYLLTDCNPTIVFVGDVIFAGSIGRTDFPGGDFNQLADGIRKILYALPDSTILLPGHGPTTTVGREKRGNPFVRQAS
jgi:glyoxylase-like metal-dependent hydrolase (beta-lactamase superfamily II)